MFKLLLLLLFFNVNVFPIELFKPSLPITVATVIGY